MLSSARDTNPVANKGSDGPIVGQDVVRITDLVFKLKKSILVCDEVPHNHGIANQETVNEN